MRTNTNRRGIAGLLACLPFLYMDLVYSEICIASGPTRILALQQHSQQCGTRATDCDPHNGTWYCAGQNINTAIIKQRLRTADSTTERTTQPAANTNNVGNSCVDPDGDGWGWDGYRSCRVNPGITETTIVPAAPNVSQPLSCEDTDGDGWGWNGTSSCRVGAIDRANQSVVIAPSATTTHDDNPACRGNYVAHNITDLILVTGQSNLTGAETTVAASVDRFGRVATFQPPDRPHPRVFAWTVDPSSNNGTGWKVARLTQSWHDSAPGVGGYATNNFAFHFAKQLANRGGCGVVGIVMVSEGGRGIDHWNNNAPGWTEINRHVHDAMSAIGRSSIDGILWHQGESDWITDGTCFTGGRCRNNLPDYYAQKLYSGIADSSIPNPVGKNALLDRLRRQSWFGNGKPFIAGQTIKAPVNIHLNKLNTDNDKWTACVRGDALSGIGIRADDPHRNHYSAEGLREMGARYASAYLEMKRR